MEGRVLVVDDEPGMLEVLSMALEEMGYRALVTQSPERALEILRTEEIELALLDIRMPGMDGRELMQKIKEHSPRLPVVFLTAFGNIKDAVSAIKEGAFDYLSKPFNLEDLQAVLARGIRYTSLLKDNERLREALEGRYSFKGIIGTSLKMRAVIEAISKVCESNVSVLILGGVRDWQGARRPGRSFQLTKEGWAVSCDQLRGHPRGPFGKRALRLCQGGIHGGYGQQAWQVCPGQQGNALFGRNRRHALRSAIEDS